MSDGRDGGSEEGGSEEAGGRHPQPGSEGDQGPAGDRGQPACEYQRASGGSEVRGQPQTPPPPPQVVKLRDVFPHGTGFVLVFDFMLSDLSEVIRNSERPLTPAQVKGYMMMLLKGVAFLHHNNIMHRVSFRRSACSSLSSSRGVSPDPRRE